ncbi:unnamed protein product [Adineta steineri]|uniref:Uncharacterized protein n=1 Tax=Adineta steineri TaxID=433720 RepID=A0A813YWM0_9BILA|nr:unnamed protein product [Adineta steineri]CAF3629625.1 unnamed protein product [Adineta steineri]
MTIASNKTLCFICNEEKITHPCKGCSKEFCFKDLAEHKQILNDELDHIVNEYNEFEKTIDEQKQNPSNHLLMKKIDQWEINSIEKIKEKAQHWREVVLEYSPTLISDIEKKFNDLMEQIKQIREENEFNEINLSYLKNQLKKITDELNNPSSISLQQNSKLFINDISIFISNKPNLNKWEQTAITVAGGNGLGQQLNQLSSPYGIFIDKKRNIFIADYRNHRIVEWKYNARKGHIIAGGSGNGSRINQLNRPTDVLVDQQYYSIIIADHGNRRVIQWWNQYQQILIDDIDCWGLAMDKNGFLYVSDWKKNEVRRWKMGEYNEGIVVAGGNGEGDQLNQLDFPTYIFVGEDQSVYVTDLNNHRVMKWIKDAKEGRILAGGHGQGRDLKQLYCPAGVIVDRLDQVYVADCGNHRIMRWCEGKEEGEIIVGGDGDGDQLNVPMGLSFDDKGNIYVTDRWNYRIEKFEIIL